MSATVAAEKRFPCGQCGARLEYAPGTSILKCPYCGHENPIADTPTVVEELDFHEALEQSRRGAETVEATLVKCSACAAEVTKPPEITALACPYCGADIVATAVSRRLIKPRGLVPFHITRAQAEQAFRTWLKKRWFAPGDLKDFARIERRLTGVYVPFWTYDCGTTTQYTGMRGDNYMVPETYTAIENGKPVTRTRMVTRIRWTPAAGVVENAFDDLLVMASRSVPQNIADELAPWNLDELRPYADEYLSGFRAESYQVDLEQGFEAAKEQMQGAIHASIRADIGGDHQQIHSTRTRYHDITFKHLLLPMWISPYRYRNKLYQILINARTGEVQGQRPYSAWKIVGFIVMLLGLAGIGMWIFSMMNR